VVRVRERERERLGEKLVRGAREAQLDLHSALEADVERVLHGVKSRGPTPESSGQRRVAEV
jgi:hypothetical protein